MHTARVVRCIERICQSQGVSIEMMSTLQHFTFTLTDESGNTATRVSSAIPHPISFEQNTILSALSWRALDQHLTLDEIRRQFLAVTQEPRLHPMLLTLMVGVANACFCKLFGGDFTAAAIVCAATIAGLLPMIPGMYAYKTVFSLILFVQSPRESANHFQYLMAFMSNATITGMVIVVLAVGATIPYFIFKRRALSMTRGR